MRRDHEDRAILGMLARLMDGARDILALCRDDTPPPLAILRQRRAETEAALRLCRRLGPRHRDNARQMVAACARQLAALDQLITDLEAEE